MNRIYPLILFISIAFSAPHCSKTDSFQSDSLTEYLNLQAGKYIIYQLDSTVKKPFDDTAFIVRSYEAKDLIDAQITDNIGRPSWRVIRYLRPLGSTSESAWEANHTYMITALDNVVEVIDNNLRFQKLRLPVKDGYTWSGNTYISPGVSGDPTYFYYGWDYKYENVGQPYKPLNTAIDSTITIIQAYDTTGARNPITGAIVCDTCKYVDPENGKLVLGISLTNEIIHSVEVYGKGTGLIYKYFFRREFQPADSNFPKGSTYGYGIRLRMISHN